MTPADHAPNGDPFGGGRAAARTLLASLAFRVRHAWTGAPAGFATFDAGAGVRTPGEVTAHLAHLMRFAATALDPDAPPPGEVEAPDPRDAEALLAAFERDGRRLDVALRDGAPTGGRLDPDAMLRGPLADALTHAGQLATLRRLAGAPVEAVSYWQVPMPAPSDAP